MKAAPDQAASAVATIAPQQKRRVLTGAALKAAERLEISQAVLARIVGVSPSTVTRMRQGSYLLDPERKEWELGALFVRFYRSLDAIVGGRTESAKAWLYSGNAAFGGRKPGEMIADTSGLVHVTDYLDACRGRI